MKFEKGREMKISEREFKKFVEDNLSRAKYFSCVILYARYKDLAWYTALRIGEMITNYFKSNITKQINIHLSLNIKKIILKLKEMKENDVLLLTTNDHNIKSITSYISSEMLNKKKNLIFISKDENPLIKQFIDITHVAIKVNNLTKGEIICIIDNSKKGERELKLTQPDKLLINKYNDLKATLLKESIRKQVSNPWSGI